METPEEKAKEAAASVQAGTEKTKATVEEKLDKTKTKDPEEKAIAEGHKDVKKHKAEAEKQAATIPEGVAGHPSGMESTLARTDGDRLATDPV